MSQKRFRWWFFFYPVLAARYIMNTDLTSKELARLSTIDYDAAIDCITFNKLMSRSEAFEFIEDFRYTHDYHRETAFQRFVAKYPPIEISSHKLGGTLHSSKKGPRRCHRPGSCIGAPYA